MECLIISGMSGAGKSMVSDLLATRGYTVINADRTYHAILKSNKEMTVELTNAFGADILNDEGCVSRRLLANKVFGKPDTAALLHTLNEITHKYVMSEIRSRLHALQRVGISTVILDAPQLFEAGANELCDAVIGIVSPRALRLARIMARDGIDEQAAAARLDAQKSDEFFSTHCDRILENNSDKKALAAGLDAILSELGV